MGMRGRPTSPARPVARRYAGRGPGRSPRAGCDGYARVPDFAGTAPGPEPRSTPYAALSGSPGRVRHGETVSWPHSTSFPLRYSLRQCFLVSTPLYSSPSRHSPSLRHPSISISTPRNSFPWRHSPSLRQLDNTRPRCDQLPLFRISRSFQPSILTFCSTPSPLLLPYENPPS